MGLSAVCDCDNSQPYLLLLGVIHANRCGFGQSAHLLGLVTVQNSYVVAQMAVESHFV